MDSKRHMYYYDGKNILLDSYNESVKFDQYYDDSPNLFQAKSQNTYSLYNSNPSNKNYIQSVEDSSYNKNFQGQSQNNFNSSQHSFNNKNNISQNQIHLISEDLINTLKDNYSKSKGYIEHKPDTLFSYVKELKNFQKKGLNISLKIVPILHYPDNDIYYSLNYYYDIYQQELQKKRSSSKTTINKFKTKFTKETLKRLYPNAEECEKYIPMTIDKFVEKLVYLYCLRMKEYSNDENQLYDFWKNLSKEERDHNNLNYDSETRLYGELIKYFNDDNILNRIALQFKNVCGYMCNHPRPLHDYWSNLINIHDKYMKGMFKYDSNTLYKIMHDKYIMIMEDTKLKDKEKEDKKRKYEEQKKEKHKINKNEYQRLIDRISKLAKPKDKWATGRVMLNLKKQFAYDNILHKMIKYEFRENKKLRHPEEYALYDSDEERKILFKNTLEKPIGKENENSIKEKIQKTKFKDDELKKKEEKKIIQISKEDRNLEVFLRKSVIRYYEIRVSSLNSKVMLNKYLSDIYTFILKNHPRATRRRFPRISYGIKKKSRFSKFPNQLKLYFSQLIKRLRKTKDGKYLFAGLENLAFWAPTLSNKCKVHGNECPTYCKHKTHNDYIDTQILKSAKMMHNKDSELYDEERLNIWKRKDLLDEKKKIFLCLEEAEHCTFEPKINKSENFKQMSNEEILSKRVSNKAWVEQMGENFSVRFPLVYKEGVLKKAYTVFQEGRFSEVIKILETAFNLDLIKAHFDQKYAEIYFKRMEEERLKIHLDNDAFAGHDKPKSVVPDKFSNPKNKRICEEVFYMLKDIEDYKKDRIKTCKKIEEELNLIKMEETNNKMYQSSSIQLLVQNQDLVNKLKFIKDKYFKFFKSIMCPLKDQCQNDQRPKWPHSYVKSNVPYGLTCPYAHHVSELKFVKEIKSKLRSKINLIENLKKDIDPVINDWIHTGPIISCHGCGKSAIGKDKRATGGCNFCNYKKKNESEIEKSRIYSSKSKERILRSRSRSKNYKKIKPEDWDSEYITKFGMLQKANILFSFRRYIDALEIIDKAKILVLNKQKEDDEKFAQLDRKWRAKLQINMNIPKEILDYEITQEVVEYFKINIPINTLLIYVDKMKKGNKFSIYNRHTYLNRQILIFHDLVVKTINKYKIDIKNLKRQINELNYWNNDKFAMRRDNPELFDKFSKKFKTSMCKNKDCNMGYRECNCAHSAIQLNLTKVKTENNLLQKNLKVTENKLKKSNVIIPWSYPKSGEIEKEKNFSKNYRKRIVYRSKSKNNKKSKSKVDINNIKKIKEQRKQASRSKSKKRKEENKSKNKIDKSKDKYGHNIMEEEYRKTNKPEYEDYLTELRIEREFRSKSEKREKSNDIYRFKIRSHEY